MPFDPIFGPTESLSDDDLLSLGRAAGFIPEPTSPPAEEANPGFMQGGLTPPEPLTSPPAVPSPQAPSNQSFGVGMGYRGYSEEQAKKVDKTRPGLNRELAQADLDAKNAAMPGLMATEQAAQGSREAAVAGANATSQKIKAEGENALVLQRLQDEFAHEEMLANAEATSQSNQAKADYLAALADFRASRVDPSQLWHNMTGGERFGTLMSAFVHDFLGARGINTSTMNTLNAAIDRNINAQVEAIKTKGEVAEGFKSLWYMQRNQSASETEARARVRGFLLEGAKQAIVANMAQYESALASAQGQAAVAKIDEELAKNLVEIYKHVDNNAIARRAQAIDQWKARLQASIEQQNVNLRAQELELARKNRDDKNKATIEPIYDPETGDARWYFIPGISDTEKAAMRESLSGAAELNKAFQELRELVRNAKPVNDLTAGTRFAGTDQQKYNALSLRIAHGFAKANGERATDQDVKDFMAGMRAKTWLNQGDAEQIIAFTQQNILAQPYAKLSVMAKELPGSPEERRAAFGVSARESPFEASIAEAHNTEKPPAPTIDEQHRSKAVETAAGIPGGETISPDEATGDVLAAHQEAARQYPHLFATEGEKGWALPVPGSGMAAPNEPAPIYKFEKSAVELARLAAKGDEKAKGELKQIAGPYLNGINSEDHEAAFAAMLLHDLENPGGLY